MTIVYVIIVLIVLLIVWVVAAFNGLVRGKQRVDEAWADIEVQLKRRHDLIPNLVETVKGYAAHEREVFEKVTEARSRAMGAKTIPERGQAENDLSATLKSLFAVAESYPDLKASQNFLELQRELTDTEDKIQAARRFYNANVRDFNIAVQTFPTNFLARNFKFAAREYFEIAEAAEREPVKVQF